MGWNAIKINQEFKKMSIDLISRVFANGPKDRGSIPGRVVPKS